jgi:hypothetical protein
MILKSNNNNNNNKNKQQQNPFLFLNHGIGFIPQQIHPPTPPPSALTM